MSVKYYQELIVWQKAMNFVESVYMASSHFPNAELYGLTSQVRRAAVSIPSNIAEGQGRTSTRDFLHFLAVAQGSLREVETQIMLACRLKFIEKPLETTLLNSAAEVGRLLSGLCNSLNQKLNQ